MRSIDRIFCVQFPLGVVFEGSPLLAGSSVKEESYAVTSPGHELSTDDFSDSETVNVGWE